MAGGRGSVPRPAATASGAAIEPSAVANHLGLASEEVDEARRAIAANWPRSLDAAYTGPDRDGSALHDVIDSGESEYERVDVSVGIGHAIRSLVPRDGKVLLLLLAFDLTQDEIAASVGVSQMHVSRILRKGGTALTASCGLAMAV